MMACLIGTLNTLWSLIWRLINAFNVVFLLENVLTSSTRSAEVMPNPVNSISFFDLPTEIRESIYAYALDVPSVINVGSRYRQPGLLRRVRLHYSTTREIEIWDTIAFWDELSTYLSMVQVCHEIRTASLRLVWDYVLVHYEAGCQSPWERVSPGDRGPRCFWTRPKYVALEGASITFFPKAQRHLLDLREVWLTDAQYGRRFVNNLLHRTAIAQQIGFEASYRVHLHLAPLILPAMPQKVPIDVQILFGEASSWWPEEEKGVQHQPGTTRPIVYLTIDVEKEGIHVVYKKGKGTEDVGKAKREFALRKLLVQRDAARKLYLEAVYNVP